MTERVTARRVASLRKRLLAWYDANRRELPWRRSRDPYSIWISETMLQQTRVETVIPYYERFVSRFPDVESLATADREVVFELWAGLGYYSRARNLHDAAKVVVRDHAGALPRDPGALLALPGVGRYTAGALASIAFDLPEAIVDGNVARLLSRVLGIREEISSKEVRARLWDVAAALARGPRPGDLNQAMMELGALVCTPRSPACGGCPLTRSCDARRVGDAAQLPLKARKKKPRSIAATAAWLPRRGKVLAVRRPSSGLLADLWELPGDDLAIGVDAEQDLSRALRENVGLSVSGVERAGEIEHQFTHLRLRLHIFRCAEVKGRVKLARHTEHRWVSPAQLARLPQAAVTRKALACLAAAEPSAPHA